MRNFSSAYGASRDKFGHADYREALKIGTPSEVVSFLSRNQGIMGSMNKKGSGGLYDQVLTEAMSRNAGKINALRGNSPYNFGHADYEAAKSDGFTDTQIKGYLDKNQNRLYSGNKPGASGGLYNQVLEGIKSKQFDYQGALSKMNEEFRQRTSAQESKYAENLSGLEDRIRDMQSRPFKPLERNRVMGIRFAGQNSDPSKKKDAFKRRGQRIQGIRSTAINI